MSHDEERRCFRSVAKDQLAQSDLLVPRDIFMSMPDNLDSIISASIENFDHNKYTV